MFSNGLWDSIGISGISIDFRSVIATDLASSLRFIVYLIIFIKTVPACKNTKDKLGEKPYLLTTRPKKLLPNAIFRFCISQIKTVS